MNGLISIEIPDGLAAASVSAKRLYALGVAAEAQRIIRQWASGDYRSLTARVDIGPDGIPDAQFVKAKS